MLALSRLTVKLAALTVKCGARIREWTWLASFLVPGLHSNFSTSRIRVCVCTLEALGLRHFQPAGRLVFGNCPSSDPNSSAPTLPGRASLLYFPRFFSSQFLSTIETRGISEAHSRRVAPIYTLAFSRRRPTSPWYARPRRVCFSFQD